MKFSHIDNISNNDVVHCKKVFKALILELCIRETNGHIGSGLGGNNFQAVVLMGMKHGLVDMLAHTLDYSEKRNCLDWSSQYLSNVKSNSDMEKLRRQLDIVFPTIVEHRKTFAVALQALTNAQNIRETFEQYKEYFPELSACLGGSYWEPNKKMSWEEKFILASIVCQNISSELDKGNTSGIDRAGTTIGLFPKEIILLTVRRYVGIERLIRYNLDEVPSWAVWLYKISKEAELSGSCTHVCACQNIESLNSNHS